MKKIVLGLLGAAIMASCGAVGNTSNISKVGTVQASLVNTQWVLNDSSVVGKKPTLIVESDNKVSGNAGCNNYFGNLSLDATAGNFDAKQIGSTRMSCNNLATEFSYLKMLNEVNKYVVSGNTLELYRDNLLLLKFTKAVK